MIICESDVRSLDVACMRIWSRYDGDCTNCFDQIFFSWTPPSMSACSRSGSYTNQLIQRFVWAIGSWSFEMRCPISRSTLPKARLHAAAKRDPTPRHVIAFPTWAHLHATAHGLAILVVDKLAGFTARSFVLRRTCSWWTLSCTKWCKNHILFQVVQILANQLIQRFVWAIGSWSFEVSCPISRSTIPKARLHTAAKRDPTPRHVIASPTWAHWNATAHGLAIQLVDNSTGCRARLLLSDTASSWRTCVGTQRSKNEGVQVRLGQVELKPSNLRKQIWISSGSKKYIWCGPCRPQKIFRIQLPVRLV